MARFTYLLETMQDDAVGNISTLKGINYRLYIRIALGILIVFIGGLLLNESHKMSLLRFNVCEKVESLENVPNTFGDGIPYILHQSWKNCEANVDMNYYISTWKKNNPDATYKLWTDPEIDDFVAKNYPEIYEYFKLLARPVMKSDVFRLMAVHTYGGTWADLDTISYSSMREWTKGHTGVKMIIGLEADYPYTWYEQTFARSLQFTQWTFAAIPKHPLMTKMLNSILIDLKSMPRRADGKIDVDEYVAVLDFAGPGMFTDVTFSYFKSKGYGWWRNWREMSLNGEKVLDVLMLPQVRWGNHHRFKEPGNWVLHKYAGSWK
jgi:alpha 1,6-mannosyltransferase